MRNVARQSRSVAQQLSKASYRQFVLRYADVVELQADGLERLALENMKTASLQESDRLRDAELEGEVASRAAQPTGPLDSGYPSIGSITRCCGSGMKPAQTAGRNRGQDFRRDGALAPAFRPPLSACVAVARRTVQRAQLRGTTAPANGCR